MNTVLKNFLSLDTSDKKYIYALNLIYKKLKPAHCFIAKLYDNQNMAQTVCYLQRGKLVENISYSLAKTPCENTRDHKGICFYPNKIQQHFPEDKILIDLNIQSYLGLSLQSHHSTPSGVLVCLFEIEPKIHRAENDLLQTISYLVGEELYFQTQLDKKNKLLEQINASESIAKTGSWLLDTKKGVVYCSQGCSQIFSLTDNEQAIKKSQLASFYYEGDLELMCDLLLDNQQEENKPFDFKSKITDSFANNKVISTRVFQYTDLASKHKFIAATVQDISETCQLQEQLELSDVMYNHTSESIIITDANNKIVSVNPAAIKVTGFSEQELIGQNPNILSSGQHDHHFYQKMWEDISATDRWQGEIYNQRKNGHVYAEQLSLNVVRDEQGNITNHIAIFHDISAWKANEKRLSFYAQRETLTKLSNRRHFISNIDHIIRHETGSLFSLLAIDIVDFRAINDIYGSNLADEVLRTLATRLMEFESNIDHLCRHGGDEFIILLPCDNSQELKAKALLLHKHLTDNFTVDQISLDLQINIGGASYPENGKTSAELLKSAFYALKNTKQTTNKSIGYFDKSLQDNYLRKLSLRDKLSRALKNKQLQVHYQPIVCLEKNRIVKFEALVRFPDRQEGFISPAEFIPVAEHFGLVQELGAFVLQRSCQDLKKLHQLGHTEISFSINRSISEFRNSSAGEAISNAISSFGLPFDAITVEITESIAMSSNQYTRSVLNSLKARGVHIALDDFGTGFSSLSNLMEYQVDIIKLDRSYIKDICTDKQQEILTSSLISIALQLGMQVIAEGVEEREQLELLKKYGCNLIQGWYFSPAKPISECLTMLSDNSLCELDVAVAT